MEAASAWWIRARGTVAIWPLIVAFAACTAEPSGLGPEDEIVAISVTPAFGRVLSVGDTARFAAEGLRADGTTVEVETIWESSDPHVATVDETGLASAVALGAVAVRAVGSDITGAAVLLIDPDTVGPRVVSIAVEPTHVNVFQRPGNVRLRIEAEDESRPSDALAVFTGPFGAGITGVVTLEPLPADSASPPSDSSRSRRAFAGHLQIPANAGVGTWVLSVLRVEDPSGNASEWGAEALARLGLGVEVEAVLTGG